MKKPKIIGIIPARMASKRFPGKPLKEIYGIPMIGHVYYRTKMCLDLLEVFVATPDEDIKYYIKSIGGKVVLTTETPISSTDRAVEALIKIESAYNTHFDIIVIVQGDEPMITNNMIATSISPLIIDKNIQVTNLMTEIADKDEIEDPNAVKVVVDINNYALYMSRSPIPFQKWGVSGLPVLKKVNVIAFKRDFLLEYAAMTPTPLEMVESIGMLRLLENGYKVKMVLSDQYTVSVDTPKDLEIVKKLMKKDSIMLKYLTNKN